MSASLPKQWLDKATEDLTVARGEAEAQEALHAAEQVLQFVNAQLL